MCYSSRSLRQCAGFRRAEREVASLFGLERDLNCGFERQDIGLKLNSSIALLRKSTKPWHSLFQLTSGRNILNSTLVTRIIDRSLLNAVAIAGFDIPSWHTLTRFPVSRHYKQRRSPRSFPACAYSGQAPRLQHGYWYRSTKSLFSDTISRKRG